MTSAALAEATGVTVVNLSVLKNNRAKAVRFSTLTAICDALGCTPGTCSTSLSDDVVTRLRPYPACRLLGGDTPVPPTTEPAPL